MYYSIIICILLNVSYNFFKCSFANNVCHCYDKQCKSLLRSWVIKLLYGNWILPHSSTYRENSMMCDIVRRLYTDRCDVIRNRPMQWSFIWSQARTRHAHGTHMALMTQRTLKWYEGTCYFRCFLTLHQRKGLLTTRLLICLFYILKPM